jgi:hypothetical protein
LSNRGIAFSAVPANQGLTGDNKNHATASSCHLGKMAPAAWDKKWIT